MALDEALIALATEGGAALVKMMVTDEWASVKGRFAQLMGRGESGRAAAAAERLRHSHAILTALPSSELERAAAEQAAAWGARLVDLLEDDPSSVGELRDLVERAKALGGGPFLPQQVQQRVGGSSRVQQAIQGHGVQVNTFAFGGPRDVNRSDQL